MRYAFSLYEVILSIIIFSFLAFILGKFVDINLQFSLAYKINKTEILKNIDEINNTIFSRNSYFNGDFNVPIFSGIVDVSKSSGNKIYLVASKLSLLQSPIQIKFKNSTNIYNAIIIDNNLLQIDNTFIIEKEVLMMDKI